MFLMRDEKEEASKMHVHVYLNSPSPELAKVCVRLYDIMVTMAIERVEVVVEVVPDVSPQGEGLLREPAGKRRGRAGGHLDEP